MSREQIREDMTALEHLVLNLSQRFSNDEILRLVNMILQGYVQGGEFTVEYLNAARRALNHRTMANILGPQDDSAHRIVLTPTNTDVKLEVGESDRRRPST